MADAPELTLNPAQLYDEIARLRLLYLREHLVIERSPTGRTLNRELWPEVESHR